MTDIADTKAERKIGDQVGLKVVVGIADAGLYLAPKQQNGRVQYERAEFRPGLK